MAVAVYGRKFTDNFAPYIQKFFDKLDSIGVGVLIYEPFLDYLKQRINISNKVKPFTKNNEIINSAEFLFSVGGDGTFLDSTTFIRDSNIPIIGINTGRLGFLSGVSINEIETALEDVFAGKFALDQRSLLKVETENNLFGANNFALNELTVHKKDSSSMVTINAFIDGDFLNSYWADGLIVATPTGSTAYALSCGGPIILPGSNNFEITPIAPHNLNVRPIVIPDDKVLTLKIEGRSQDFLVSLDSRSKTIDSSVELKISKNNFTINLARLHNENILGTIRNKLNWGLDQRN
ncbi:MAG: NAD kinase [Flavobacteriales bacterium]|nr:NAD kinase [Flavobacteriales bacterium]